ncbi:DNA repair ATPase [Pseudoalteromonas sp. MMG024]|uniref:DNA repair ATPase n=1 Tax=Pseudoalteromonas sp. MMG024 TaxID=2909980 RepID=UPI001F40399C|nr:DNA repair ATPase [Pseudoalteromonas sp. MMG024]MCF6455756.1 DNA repair ATPase [Pseudoalteromonas sp. MMG024]
MTEQAQQTALEQGSYDLIKRRLNNLGNELKSSVDAINQQRIESFGSTELQVKGRVRVRTENNCVPRDIVVIGDKLIFAYNVFIGLKTNTSIHDVFSVHKLSVVDEHFEIDDYPSETRFLTDSRFIRDFEELYTYYKQAKLQHLFAQHGKLYALFQIGDKLSDVRVFRWQIENDNTLNYIDNRGERDIQNRQDYDFEWEKTSREHHVEGAHPHINVNDTIFIDTKRGALTFKIENNTDSGQGIYSEPLDDKNQSLADCELEYALVGDLVLLKVLPYREKEWRYFIYNTRTQTIVRQDAISHACVSLPEDHGIIYPGGYYLQSGQSRYFEDNLNDLEFHKQLRSPNGEDVLYVFYEPSEGRYALFAYNIIEKNLQNPIYCHGYGVYQDGLTVTFKGEKDEAERVHPLQIWQSPFVSAEYAANAPAPTDTFGKIGNPDLVRGISDLFSVCRAIQEQTATQNHYEDLISLARAIFDRYHWLTKTEFEKLNSELHSVLETAEQVLDEFEKVTQIQSKAKEALDDINEQVQTALKGIRPDSFKLANQFVESLAILKQLSGKVISLEDVKYIDVNALSKLQQEITEQEGLLSNATAKFLQKDEALEPYHKQLKEISELGEKSEGVSELNDYLKQLDALAGELDLLNHTMLDLEIDDSRVRTQILEDISGVYALVNRAKASIEIRRKSLGSVEAKAEFAARFKLFSQSITGALNSADTPEECDEQLSRLLIQLEELESLFSEHDEYLAEIIAKRDDVYESFEAHKQKLLDEQQRRALSLTNAAERILQGVTRRLSSFNELDALNSYFAGDPMISKLRKLIKELQSLGDEIRADDLEAKLKATRDQGIRALRDKQDIYTDGGNTVSIGKHAFGVNNQALDLTLLPRDDALMFHLTGTDYFEPITDAETAAKMSDCKAIWQQSLVSENNDVYRGEYLAYQMLHAARNQTQELTLDTLLTAQKESSLLTLVQKFAEPRYQESYDKGIHDHDAAIILDNLLAQSQELGLLTYPIASRFMAQALFINLSDVEQDTLQSQAQNSQLMSEQFGNDQFKLTLSLALTEKLESFANNLPALNALLGQISYALGADYLINELANMPNGSLQFTVNKQAKLAAEQFIGAAKSKGFWQTVTDTLTKLTSFDEQAALTVNWLKAYAKNNEHDDKTAIEAASFVLFSTHFKAKFSGIDTKVEAQVTGLMGQHARINEQTMALDYAEFSQRLTHYNHSIVPNFERYHALRKEVIDLQKDKLQLDEFKAKPLSSFVRNQLIDKVYFPIIGDNLAKQIGASGKTKRTDLMGMLLLISPPGYGKTTLIEYIANRLGLTFVKVNCPSIGHDQVSLDPAQAINATAAKEIEKINQSFEMGNNVMLYLDDIQHTNPEFLQKFISLCDGSRRIDGVWNGKSKTYDLRGKKFSVVMAGNPYTESGESFKIPDMLANRADIYNLGDTLAGCEQEFAMSFIENSLTSNAVMAPLANRNMQDLYKFVRICQGEDISLNELEYSYSKAEANEITSVLDKLMHVRNTVLKVNAQYIASAAQDDIYRTEPPFKLQGSYRNMNKMAEKIVAAMNDDELENLVQDHYRGEAQTLSKGSEENLLKLAELRGTLSEQDAERWQQIKKDYSSKNKLDQAGSAEMMAVEQLANVHSSLEQIGDKLNANTLVHNYQEQFGSLVDSIRNLDNANALNTLTDTLSTQLSTSPYQDTLTEIAQTIASNNSIDALGSISNALAQGNQQSTQYTHSLQDLTQAVETLKLENIEQLLAKLVTAQDNTANSVALQSDVLSQSIAHNNTNETLNHIAKQLSEGNEQKGHELEKLQSLVQAVDSEKLTKVEQLLEQLAQSHQNAAESLNQQGEIAIKRNSQLAEISEQHRKQLDSYVQKQLIANSMVEQMERLNAQSVEANKLQQISNKDTSVLIDTLNSLVETQQQGIESDQTLEVSEKLLAPLNLIAQSTQNQSQTLNEQLAAISSVIEAQQQVSKQTVQELTTALSAITPNVTVDNHTDPKVAEAVSAIAETIDASLLPVLKIMQHKVRLDHDVWNKVDAVSKQLKTLDSSFEEPEPVITAQDKAIIVS